MEAVVGKWKYDPSNTKGLPEFIAAINKPQVEPMYQNPCTMTITKDGNKFSSTTNWENGKAYTIEGQLGQKVVFDADGIGKAESVSQFDGTYFITTSTYDGVSLTSKAKAEGGAMTMEITGNGKTVVAHLTKV